MGCYGYGDSASQRVPTQRVPMLIHRLGDWRVQVDGDL